MALTAALAVSACGSAGARPQPAPHPTDTSARAAVTAGNTLALELLSRIASTPSANTVFSPYSIQAALTIADAGAAGQTAAQISHVLRAPADALSASNATLAARLAAATKPPAHARAAINRWIAAHTANRIKDLLPPTSITPATKLVLANAIYLKAHWANPFEPRDTAPATFFTGAGIGSGSGGGGAGIPPASVKAEFMTLPATSLSYARGHGYQAVELAYLDSFLSMLLVLPAPGGLTAFQRSLTPAALARIERGLAPTRVRLLMPRLHLTTHADLLAALSALGMPLAFSDHADFSAITAKLPLKIGAIEHGADLTLDEQGTVAAAATGVTFLPTAVAPVAAVNLTLDHPFLLFLRDQQTGAILFAGRITDPSRS